MSVFLPGPVMSPDHERCITSPLGILLPQPLKSLPGFKASAWYTSVESIPKH